MSILRRRARHVQTESARINSLIGFSVRLCHYWPYFMGVVMKATIGKQVSNADNYGYKKELIRTYNVVTDALKEIITVRCYMGRSSSASVVYASIWINSPGYHSSGKGKASGYGYHKESAAIAAAIESAGITLDQSIDGVGDAAIEEALKAIASALGFSHVLIVEN